jgi:two-component system, cell cycle sensor histidine kinase and response regulator CckA
MDLTVAGGMGAKEAIKKLLQVDPGAKVIVSTGYSNDPIAGEYKSYGFRGFIAKPSRIEDLVREINRVVNIEE